MPSSYVLLLCGALYTRKRDFSGITDHGQFSALKLTVVFSYRNNYNIIVHLFASYTPTNK